MDLDFDGHVDRWDRDEEQARLDALKEREEEEKAEAAAEAAAEADGGAGPSDGGVTDAYVSPRKR